MKKAYLFILILLVTDLASAQMMFSPAEKQQKTIISQYDETNSLNEMMRRRKSRRGRGRGRGSNFAAGGSITTMKLFESAFDDKFRIGMGANAWFNLSESNAIKGGVYYFLPATNEFLDIKNTTSYFQINLHFQQFVAGSSKDDVGFYAFGGFGYIVNFNKTETTDIIINARYTNVNIDLGIGAQFNLNFAFAFVEAQGSLGLLKFEIPTDASNGINVPSFMNFRAGMKFPLNF